ncbi:unnamed protein product, partial [Pelagomonas calceolata]
VGGVGGGATFICRTRLAFSYRVDSVEPVSRRERLRSLRLRSRVVLWSLPTAPGERSKIRNFQAALLQVRVSSHVS